MGVKGDDINPSNTKTDLSVSDKKNNLIACSLVDRNGKLIN